MDSGSMEGLRVIRGPDWQWGQQDGGEGYVGTVTLMEEVEEGNPVVVQWDCAGRCKYRCGADGKYDLRVLDTAPTGVTHPRLTCTWCDESPLIGTVWKCVYCYDYYLCTTCYMGDRHSLDHPFHRCLTTDLKKRVRVPPRFLATKLPVMGMFPGSKVKRGPDWQWHNQDGGRDNHGQVTKIQGWKTETFRSVVEVMWNGAQASNVYRRAHHGKVDLRCVGAAEGGRCYIDHLALLGYQYQDSLDAEIAAGDSVMVQADPDVFKVAQDNHGGWNDGMAEFIGRAGVVKSIASDNETARVHYSDNTFLILNKDILVKIDAPTFHSGDVIRVIDDMVEVHSLQSGHGEWNDDMALSLGQVGKVLSVSPNFDVVVRVSGGRRWVLNPKCLVPAPEDALAFVEEEMDFAIDLRAKQRLTLFVQAGLPDVITAAAAVGDVKTLQTYLDKNPHEVNHKKEGKGALHLAVLGGYPSVIKTMLPFDPDLEIKDNDGETPLHRCARTNDSEAAKLLVNAGGDVNAREFREVTPITMAAALGHSDVLEVLLTSPSAMINIQDNSGSTPLHRAVDIHHRNCVRVLMEHGANPILCNFELYTSLHEAARKKFLSGIEEILRFHPQHINVKRDDGFTTFHVAATVNSVDIVTYMASHQACDINMPSKDIRLTPLHTAIHEGHVAVIEKLVGIGVKLNATLGDGRTPLHVALARNNMKSPSNDTPHIREIQEEVEASHGKGVISANMIVCLFLAANGADIHVKDLRGQSPQSLCPRDCSSILNKYAGRRDSFYGSLKGLTQISDPPKPIKQWHATEDTTPPRQRTDTQVPSPAPSSSPHTIQHSYSVPPDTSMKTGNGSGQAVTPPPKANGHLGSITKEVIKEENVMNNLLESVELTEEAPDILECFLCESGADIKLMPCGHVNMCHNCPRPKKCPECRTAVAECVVVCVLCQSETVSKTLQPCGHTYCSGCGSDLKYCKACKDDQK